MKKLLALVVVAGMVAFVACGPSKKDLEAKAKKTADSIAAVEKEKRTADSLAAIEKEKKKADSLAEVEKNKAPKGGQQGGTKTNTGGTKDNGTTTPKNQVKAGQGKG